MNGAGGRRHDHDQRIREHPILPVEPGEMVPFYWNGKVLTGRRGEALSSALIAAGVAAFGRNAHDHSPQGIFCANGQCSKCLVMANGRPVKSCMTPLAANMVVERGRRAPRAAGDQRGSRAGRRSRDPDRCARHWRRAGRAFRRRRTGPAGHRHAAGRRQGRAGRQAGAADPQVLRLGRGFPGRHPAASASAASSPRRSPPTRT